jgi:hypothetical protein
MPGKGNDEVSASTKSHGIGFGRSDCSARCFLRVVIAAACAAW